MVENEFHFLRICSAYERESSKLLDLVRSKFKLSRQELCDGLYDINNIFTRIMESDDSDIINETADYLDRAFFKRERLLLSN